MPRGVLLVALLTPFTGVGEIDGDALQAHVAALRSAGVDGFFVCGTTGEGPLLEDAEVLLVTRTVLSACQGKSSVITQVGRPSTKATARLLGAVLGAGAHGITAVAPYYYELDEVQLEAHYRELLRAADGDPLYAYNIPRRTGNDLSSELVRRLAGIGLAGIKDSTRSLERHFEYLQIATERLPRPFEVYMGTDGLALEALRRGSTGVVSAIANLQPQLFLKLRDAVIEDRFGDANCLQNEICGIRDSLQRGNTIANLKIALSQRWAESGADYPTSLRPPLGIIEP
jgi:4-hydroxy-tetrahydrodipicolinate synthase